MSSARGKILRHQFDYYVTPQSEIEKFIKTSNFDFATASILDPAAGGDDSHEMSYPAVIKKLFGRNIDTIDIREDSRAAIKQDYLSTDCRNKYDIIITNPPWCLAMEFIKKAIEEVKENGVVIMLLRLNFLGSRERNEWLKANMPHEIYVHAKRMSFVDKGGTDSIEYAHFVWKKGNHGKTKLYLLDY